MPAAESISSIVADMYDAALDPSRWVGVFEKTANYVGGPRASFWLEVAEIGPEHHHFGRKDFWQKQLSTQSPESGPPLRASGATVTGNVFYRPGAVASVAGPSGDHPVGPRDIAGIGRWPETMRGAFRGL